MNLSFMKQMISLLRVNVNLSLIVDLVRCQTSTNLRNYISKKRKTQDSNNTLKSTDVDVHIFL